MRTGALLFFRIIMIMGTLKKSNLNALLVQETKSKQFIIKLLDQPIYAVCTLKLCTLSSCVKRLLSRKKRGKSLKDLSSGDRAQLPLGW